VGLTKTSSLVLATYADMCFSETGTFQKKKKSGFVEKFVDCAFWDTSLPCEAKPGKLWEKRKKKVRFLYAIYLFACNIVHSL